MLGDDRFAYGAKKWNPQRCSAGNQKQQSCGGCPQCILRGNRILILPGTNKSCAELDLTYPLHTHVWTYCFQTSYHQRTDSNHRLLNISVTNHLYERIAWTEEHNSDIHASLARPSISRAHFHQHRGTFTVLRAACGDGVQGHGAGRQPSILCSEHQTLTNRHRQQCPAKREAQ